MIIRTLTDKTVVKIDIPIKNEDKFIAKNPTGGFSIVDSLPNAKYPYWKLNAKGKIIPDAAKILAKDKLVKISNARNKLIFSLQSIPIVNLKGSKFTLSNSLQDQTNSLLAISTSQQVLQSPAHKLNTAYKLNDVVNLNGTIVICSAAGTTDKNTAPTTPTDFGVEVADGTAGWKLFGQLLGLYPTGIQFFTPQDIIYLTAQSNEYITYQRRWYGKIKAQIKACTTQADLDKVVW